MRREPALPVLPSPYFLFDHSLQVNIPNGRVERETPALPVNRVSRTGWIPIEVALVDEKTSQIRVVHTETGSELKDPALKGLIQVQFRILSHWIQHGDCTDQKDVEGNRLPWEIASIQHKPGELG